MKLRFILLGAYLMSFACGKEEATLKFGLLVGGGYAEGAALAVEEINEAGGIRGNKLVLVDTLASSSTDAPSAIEAALYYASRKDILAVIGHENSPTSLAASRIYNHQGLPQLIPDSTSPLLTQAGPWTFRVCVSDQLQGKFLADFVMDKFKDRKRIAVLYVNDDYGKGLKETFVASLKEPPFQIVFQMPYFPNTDFNPLLIILKQKAPDLVFLAGRIDEAEKIYHYLKKSGLQLPLIGGDGLYRLNSIAEKAEEMEGMMMTMFFNPWDKSEKVQGFVQRYQTKFGQPPQATAALTYDAVYLLKLALERGGLSRQKIRDYLATVGSSNPAFEGVTGTIAFDENGDCVKPLIIGVVKNATVVPMEN
ncbi:MAG: ABC transporter substrate-binding protein [candidate division KSB1 bacterium]|nr:ABC transporter substrate-binding protein [candidate division KSB1 bacterium]